MNFSKEIFLKKLDELQKNNVSSTELYSLFVSSVKSYPELVLQELLPEYEALLDNPDSSLKRAGFFSLLFKLKIKKNSYLQKALKTINDFYEDADLRVWTTSSIGVAYESTKNLQILQVLWRLYKQPILSEEEYYCDWLREKNLQTLLEIWLPTDVIQAFMLQWYSKNQSHKKTIQRMELAYKTEILAIQTFLQNELANNLTSKISALRALSTRRPLLVREKMELDFLQKIQAADNIETLQSIENEVNSTPTDPELIKQLLHNINEKKAFY